MPADPRSENARTPGFAPFGHTPDGEEILQANIATDTLEARIITLGAIVADLRVQLPGETRRVVLGFDDAEPYLLHSPHIGAIAGRYAGRIRRGRFPLDGEMIQLSRNAGEHHVHGGHIGFGRRNWRAVEAGRSHATLGLISPDGDEGYPGALSVFCTIRLDGAWVWIDLEATADKPTPVNLIHHGYFNLDGRGTVAGHRLTIMAQELVETASDGLPTGRFIPAKGVFDFRDRRDIDPTLPYDVSYRLHPVFGEAPRCAARLESAAGDLAMEVWTSEPGLHLYDSHKLDVPVPGLGGERYGVRHGICLEPTRFSDAPNHPAFPETILRPGETYRQRTGLRFVNPAFRE